MRPARRGRAALVRRAILPARRGPDASPLTACMFANSPVEHFVIDVLPEHPRVSVSAGTSGHGFKFSSVVGEIMADLVESGQSRHDVEMFRLARFARSAAHRSAAVVLTASGSHRSQGLDETRDS